MVNVYYLPVNDYLNLIIKAHFKRLHPLVSVSISTTNKSSYVRVSLQSKNASFDVLTKVDQTYVNSSYFGLQSELFDDFLRRDHITAAGVIIRHDDHWLTDWSEGVRKSEGRQHEHAPARSRTTTDGSVLPELSNAFFYLIFFCFILVFVHAVSYL